MNAEEKPKRQRRKKEAVGTTEGGAKQRATRRRRKTSPPQGPALVRAPADKVFWVWQGGTIADLEELGAALEGGMTDEQFAHHVGPHRNDFARWVEEVLGNTECAAALRQARTRAQAASAVAEILSSSRTASA